MTVNFDLMQITASNAVDLTEDEALILAEMADEETAYELRLARVRIAPGGVGQFQMGEDMARSFVAVVAISQIVRGYWPEVGTGAPPLCSSPDGQRGRLADPTEEQFMAAAAIAVPHPGIVLLGVKTQDPLPDNWECVRCPLNRWGSEHQRRGNGRGKACKEMRRLLLLVDGWALPALMSLPPTSLKPWDGYCSALASRRGAYFAVKTRFELDTAKAATGEPYSVVQVSVAERLSTENLHVVRRIRHQYRSLVAGLPVEATEYDEEANVPAEAAEAMEKPPF